MKSEQIIPFGYKSTSVGPIPIDWQLIKIKDIGVISSGTTPLRSEKKFHQNGTIPWVKTTDLNNSVIIKTEEKITDVALKETSLRIFPKDTVLVAMYGGFNQIGRTGILGIEATINQALSAITVDIGFVFPKFLLYWFNLKVGLWKNFAGSSRKDPNITSKDVADFPFIKISLKEQIAISNCLFQWERAIAKFDTLISFKELRKKWLIQQLLTGRKRIPGFYAEWKKHSFESLLTMVKRTSEWDDKELYNLISVRRRSGGIFPRESLWGHQILVKELRDVKEGDFLFSKMQIVHGASALVTKEYEGYKISGSYIAVISKDPSILNIEYFNLCSQLPFFYHQTFFSSYGVHIEKMTFDFESFLTLGIIIPPIEEQKAIAVVIKKAEKEINLLKNKLEKLKEQKKGLMQVLLTGKIRLNT